MMWRNQITISSRGPSYYLAERSKVNINNHLRSMMLVAIKPLGSLTSRYER